jgi:hypothetical protein
VRRHNKYSNLRTYKLCGKKHFMCNAISSHVSPASRTTAMVRNGEAPPLFAGVAFNMLARPIEPAFAANVKPPISGLPTANCQQHSPLSSPK